MSGDISTFPQSKFGKKFPQATSFGLDPVVTKAIRVLADDVSTRKYGTRIDVSGAADLDIDASAGSDFMSILTGNRNINAPTNFSDLQTIRLWITQDATGSRTVTWNSAFRFSSSFPIPTLTTTPEFTDMFEFIFNPYYQTWDCIRIVAGFDSTTPP